MTARPETLSSDLARGGAALYCGRVTHRRLKPVGHRLAYDVFAMLLDLDGLDDLDRGLKWFSRGKFNLFSFHDADYGAGAPRDLAAYVRGVLAGHGLDGAGALKLLCYPRMLGYAFNPLAVYYCHDRTGALSAILYEVSNTFGGRHSYLVPVSRDVSRGGEGGVLRQTADKVFHVSPFMEMETRYHFKLKPPGEDVLVAIRQTDADGAVLNAVFAGARLELTDAALREMFFRYPLMTVKVIAGIHWEAAKLFAKGLRLMKGASTPAAPVTLVEPR